LAAAVGRLGYVAEQEGIDCPQDALEVIARTATGSLRDAINLLEQLVDGYGKKLTLEQVKEELGLVVDARSAQLATHTLREELAEGLTLIGSVRDDGLDLRQFQRQVVAYLRGLLLVKAGAATTDAWSEEQLAEMSALVADVSAARIAGVLRAFGEADLRADPLSPLPLELALANSVLAKAPPSPAAAVPAPRAEPAAAPPPPRPAAVRPPKQDAKPKRENAPAKPPAAKPAARAEAPAKPVEPVAKPAAEVDTPDEPAGEPVAVSATAGPSQEDVPPSLAEARAHWPEIYKRAREIHYKAGALLNSGCGIIEASEGEIVFGFRHAMLLDRMQGDSGENLRALQQAVDDVLGEGRTLRCVLDPNVEVQRPGRGGHLVRAAEELGGRLVPDDD
ncbi:MAG: hypothetical protein IIC88_02480, partial [Chloroflexi bacterium]|nr:hypothetical protein [Chloroflexota bacterium]